MWADEIDSDYNEINYKYGFGGLEMQGCRKVEVLRAEAAVPDSFLFEEYCSNFSEGIRWSRAARRYKTRFIKDVVRTYVQRGGEALTASNAGRNRSEKRTYNLVVMNIYGINEQRDLMLRYRKKQYLKTLLVLAYHSLCLKRGFAKHLEHLSDRFIYRLMFAPAALIYAVRK